MRFLIVDIRCVCPPNQFQGAGKARSGCCCPHRARLAFGNGVPAAKSLAMKSPDLRSDRSCTGSGSRVFRRLPSN